MDGAIATSSSLEDPTKPASNAIDGDYAGRGNFNSCTATLAGADEWFRLELTESFPVRTIFHVTDTQRPFTNFFYTVGDDPDVSLNPKCSETAYTNGGLYECHLNGKFFGIIKPDSDPVHLCELRLYSRKSTVPHFTTSSSPIWTNKDHTFPGKIGPHSLDCPGQLDDYFIGNLISRPYWMLDFGVTTRVTIAVVTGD